MSSQMRLMMAMMEQREDVGGRAARQSQMDELNRNNTLEINPNHNLIIKLN